VATERQRILITEPDRQGRRYRLRNFNPLNRSKPVETGDAMIEFRVGARVSIHSTVDRLRHFARNGPHRVSIHSHTRPCGGVLDGPPLASIATDSDETSGMVVKQIDQRFNPLDRS